MLTHLTLEFPESLPVCARREEIEQALHQHQVIIVCGETGSGKTTQLPKIALSMGRGQHKPGHPPTRRAPMIGHTQPRRIAASSVAKRIAEELHTPLGEVVGYKVRFQDRLQPGASIKLMTDGILLAETQTDPLLRAYDTLIIDEAHERSLNIDFLLGYIRQILPQRPDLKVIITSATIDAQRFAQHFASAQGPAPVIMVSGRTFAVEQRWRPFEESRDFGLNEAIAQAVDELWIGHPQGDILVFLPGEREIREVADHLRGHLSHSALTRHAEVLPLFSRLSQAEQDRIFESHNTVRVVLATNVAETSLTVPGIRFVVDTGTARVKRYSLRSKVEQLLVEPISQAAANQRSGRCGRVANGVCIRLYDEADFNARPRFTDPEILRSSLAGVILRMKSLHLSSVEEFPFIEAPSKRAITDGYQLLSELGALTDTLELTPLGQELAQLPLDPCIGRMLLEARQRHALEEILIIASALSVQDVRDRPLHLQTQADQAHAKFDDERSEFSSYLTLWNWLLQARGGQASTTTPPLTPTAQASPPSNAKTKTKANTRHAAFLPVAQRMQGTQGTSDTKTTPNQRAIAPAPTSTSTQAPSHKLSHRQYDNLLRQNFINPRRVREWRDIHSQLLALVNEHRWRLNTLAASYEQIHLSMLAGLLGSIGCKHEEEDVYVGARGIKFHRHPGAHLRKKPGRWIMCAEITETTRLFGRVMANIEPTWIEQVGSHLLKKQVLDPHWDARSGEVLAYERATLHGLLIYNGRRVNFAKLDQRSARETFIRQALVAQQWESKLPFFAANRNTIARIEEIEHKSRRQDVLVDEEIIYAYYDRHVPQEVYSTQTFEQWYTATWPQHPKLLHITPEELMRHEAASVTAQAFPKLVRLGGVDCQASYLHEPGHVRDGLSVTIPLFVLNQVSEERCEWLVPGMLKEKIQALLKSLPQKPRARLVPLPESAQDMAQKLSQPERFGSGSLLQNVLELIRQHTQLDVKLSDFKPDMLATHLRMNLRVVDEHGRQLGTGRSLGALKAELGTQARGAFQALANLKLRPDTKTQAPSSPTAAAQAQNQDTRKQQDANQRTPTASATAQGTPQKADQRHTQWDFGELPELMEIRKGQQTLIGFPALIDQGDAVTLEVFDEPELAQRQHRLGLRRLFALQIRDALKYLEKNIPDLQKMAVAYMPLGTQEDLRQHIVNLALDRTFVQAPWPTDAQGFTQREEQGRARLNLITQEIARTCATILQEYAHATRKVKDSKTSISASAHADCTQQLQRMISKNFVHDIPWQQLQHIPRYLKAIIMRLDKYRADPQRDAQRQTELQPLEQRYWRLVAERKGAVDTPMQEFRWLLEELRVSLFAQELRTPQPVSIKRLEKAWSQLSH